MSIERAALISDEAVTSVIVVDTEDDSYTPPGGYALVQVPAGVPVGPGWGYRDGIFIAPPAPDTDPEE